MLLSSRYAAFTGAYRLQFYLDLVLVTEEMHTEGAELWKRINAGFWKPVTNPPWFEFSRAE